MPAGLGKLLDVDLGERAQPVYARPVSAPPHGWPRNRTSGLAK